MNDNENSYRPLITVMVRRGDRVVRGIPTKMLVPYIEGKKLLRTDFISGDGKRWTRLDEHFQLTKYFKDETSSKVLRDAPSPFPQEEDAELEEEGVGPPDDDGPAALPNKPPHLENQLNQMAQMLKDLNR